MYTIDAASYGVIYECLDFWTFSGTSYVGHYMVRLQTQVDLFFGNITSPLAFKWFYISYNFNIQGADMHEPPIDNPVIQFLMNTTTGC